MRPLVPPTLEEIRAARERIAGAAVRTPLLRFSVEGTRAEIWLKLENLQPIGSFKLRGATNALRCADPHALRDGVWTASAGNMAQGVAWSARELSLPCTVVMPDHAPVTKRAAVERLGASIVSVPFERWWRVLQEHRFPDLGGLFIHPVSDPAVLAGNGTVGLEILDDLPDADTILVPFGGGGLSCGIAAAVKAIRPGTRVVGCEVETAAPLAASFQAGEPRQVDHRPSFVDGIGGKSVLEEMWPLVRDLLDGARVASLAEVAAAVRLLAEHQRVIAEGAGATPVAVALAAGGTSGDPGDTGKDQDKVVCVISGGNLDTDKLAVILTGGVP